MDRRTGTGQEDWDRSGRLIRGRKAETGHRGAEMWTGRLGQGRKIWERAGKLDRAEKLYMAGRLRQVSKALRQGRKLGTG